MARKLTCPKCDMVLGNRRQLKVHVTYCVGRPALSTDQRKFMAERLLRNSMLKLTMADLAGAPPVVVGDARWEEWDG